jgi:hypothetical protein
MKMNDIVITGLNNRQKILADIIWNIEEWDQVEIFMSSLPERDRIDCEGIIEMMRMQLVEIYAEGMGLTDYPEANELIAKVKRK